jgi:hypothetical protein
MADTSAMVDAYWFTFSLVVLTTGVVVLDDEALAVAVQVPLGKA